jgi:hypothetical protein
MPHTPIPSLIFGAFDRHNFGDLLFAHVAAAMLPGRRLLFAGLAARDLRACGGHRVKAVARLAQRWCDRQLNVFHAGGELLTCGAWEAAVMLLPPDRAREAIAAFDATADKHAEWAAEQLGVSSRAPYCVSRSQFPNAASVIFHAVGGVDLDTLDASMRAEVLDKLRRADCVSVRDRQTLAHLEAAGIAARLVPDPAVMTAELFGSVIRAHATNGETARMAHAFPQGYVTVQFSAEFGDDSVVNEIARQLDEAAMASGHGIVFFRAGAAPWHDEIDCYERVAARMHSPAQIFQSLDLWDICALIAGSRAYLGSSLHGRIVAMAYALPRVNLRHPAQMKRPSKQEAFAATWDMPNVPGVIDVRDIADGLHASLAADRMQLQRTAEELVAAYRRGFSADAVHLAPL